MRSLLLALLTLLSACPSHRPPESIDTGHPVVDTADTDAVTAPDTGVADTDTGTCPYVLEPPSYPLASSYCTGIPDGTTVQDGSLFQLEATDAIQYASGGMRFAVTADPVLQSWWGADACGVCGGMVAVTSDVVVNIPLGGNVTIHPGTFMIRIASDEKIYVIERCRSIALVDPAVAEEIYGTDWETFVRTIPDVFFVDYIIAEPVTSAADYDLADVLAATIDEELSCN